MEKANKPLPSQSSSDDEEETSSADDEQPPATTAKPVVSQTQTQTQTREEAESESESSDESSEDEDEKGPANRPVNNASEKPPPSTSKPAADGESDSDSDSESESGDSEPPKLITPINSRPMAAGAPKDSDAKKSNGKRRFQRIWTFDDDVEILKGMSQFQSERGPIKPTTAGIEDFHAFIQNKLSLEVVSKRQLLDKIKRLKSRYLAVAARDKNGPIYELVKNIWGLEDENEGRPGAKYDGDENEGRPSAKYDGGARSSKRNFPLLKAVAESMGSNFAEEKLAKIDLGKAEALEKRFKKQKLAEVKHHMRKMDMWKETLKLIMEGIERATS